MLALDRASFDYILGPLEHILEVNMNCKLLEKIDIFSNLSNADLRKLLEFFTNDVFEPGEIITTEGKAGSKFYIIKHGTAKVSSKGRELGELQQGAYFAQNALTEKNKMPVTGT